MAPKIVELPTVDALAAQFSGAMRETLTPEQMLQVVERNESEVRGGVCHTHDI